MLTYVSDDFYDDGYKLFQPDQVVEPGFNAVYALTDTVRLISAVYVTVESTGLIRLPYVDSLLTGSKVYCLFDYGSHGLSFIDRTLEDFLELHTTFTITNTEIDKALVDITIISKDLDFHIGKDTALSVSNIKYTNGEPSQGFNLDTILSTGTLGVNFAVLHNNQFAGLLANTNGYLNTDFSSPKRGKVEVVKLGNFQFAAQNSSSWVNAYQLNRLSPGESITVALRCRVDISKGDRHLNGVLLLAQEELT